MSTVITPEELRLENCGFLEEYCDFNISPEDARVYVGGVYKDTWYSSEPYRGAYQAFQMDTSMRVRLAEGKQRFCLLLSPEYTFEKEDGKYRGTVSAHWYYGDSADVCGLESDGQNIYCSLSINGATLDETDPELNHIETRTDWNAYAQPSAVTVISISTGARWHDKLYFKTNVPVFNNVNQARNYVANGVKVGCLNAEGEAPYVSATLGKRYYYNMELFRTSDGDYANAVSIAKRSWECYSEGIVTGYCNAGGAPYNVKFLVGGSSLSTKYTENGVTTTGLTLAQINSKQWSYVDTNDLLYDGTYYYYTNVTTNITMRGTRTEAQKVSNNEEPEDHSLSTHRNRMKSDLTDQRNSDRNFRSAMCSVWKTSYQGTNHLADALYSTSTEVIDAIKEGLQLMGTNPIDCVCGMWHSPISLDQFTTVVSQHMKIGNYTITDWNFDRCGGQKYVDLCSVFIPETYGNFLDYTNMSLSLYLPFVGLFEIETAVFINKVMRITVGVDLFNATMKYWIYADEKLVMDKSCNFGCQMAVSGNDQVGRAREAIQSVNQVQNDILGTISAAAINPTVGASGATKLVTNGVLGTTPAAMGFANKGKMMTSGTTSSGVSCGDILYPFLVIDVQDAIIPPELYDVYGMPCNMVTTLGKCSGWTECYDVQLKGGMLPEERDAIIKKLNEGVIL